MYYLNEDLEIKKSHKLTDIIALTVKQDDDLTDKYDFMVHIKNESDYMFYSKHREEIITCLRSAYFMITETNLPVFEVSMKIDKYRTRKNAPQKLPPDTYKAAKMLPFQPLSAEEKKQIEQCIAEGHNTTKSFEISDEEVDFDIEDEGTNLSAAIPLSIQNRGSITSAPERGVMRKEQRLEESKATPTHE